MCTDGLWVYFILVTHTTLLTDFRMIFTLFYFVVFLYLRVYRVRLSDILVRWYRLYNNLSTQHHG